MLEKQGIKISLSTFFLIIAIIVIVIMGYFIYINNEDAKTEENSTNNESDSISFTKLMDMIYPSEFEKNSIQYSGKIIEDIKYATTSDVSGDLNVQTCDICVSQEDKSINIRICDTEKSIDNNYTVTGINEEVVSIQVITFETEAIPSQIYFLTRNGNVYYVENSNYITEMTNFSGFEAIKISEISQAISISSVSAYDNSLLEPSYGAVIATLYNGNYEIIGNY